MKSKQLKTYGLKPLIKYPGGKEKELPLIFENLPTSFQDYYEPFVGGGSVHMAMSAPHHFINDKSKDLIDFYRALKNQDTRVLFDIENINSSWKNLNQFMNEHRDELVDIYKSGTEKNLNVLDFIEKNYPAIKLIFNGLTVNDGLFKRELVRCVPSKFNRMRNISTKNGALPESDIFPNLTTAFISSLYSYYRSLYNTKDPSVVPCRVALYVFLRYYAYSGMFRFNPRGEFNVPYGGMGYNKNFLDSKIAYWKSPELIEHFEKTTIEAMDFRDFINAHPPTSDDFMFLDPPYDSEFSTYDGNEFGKAEQCALANYLLDDCPCKWMMVIKNTDFIRNLYDGHGLSIKAFDKKYSVSFMNRNNKNVTHLIIMNY